MNVVYISHPYGGKPENLARAKRWFKWALKFYPECAFVADWILMCEGEEGDAGHELGLMRDCSIVKHCDEIWLVGGTLSPGMEAELNTALAGCIQARNLTALGSEPPNGRAPFEGRVVPPAEIPSTKISQTEKVNHPSHYNSHPSGIECVTIAEAFNFNLGNALKYIWRAGLKTEDPTEDLKKGAWYLQRELDRLAKKQS